MVPLQISRMFQGRPSSFQGLVTSLEYSSRHHTAGSTLPTMLPPLTTTYKAFERLIPLGISDLSLKTAFLVLPRLSINP